jgi:hypothetical protein
LGALAGTLATIVAVSEGSHDERGTVLVLGYAVLGFTLFAVAMSMVIKQPKRLKGQAPSSSGVRRITWVIAVIGLLLFGVLIARALTFGNAPAYRPRPALD